MDTKNTKKRILVVDDDTYIRDIYQELLTDENYDVNVAFDGEDALHKVQNTEYDLIVLDVMMPKLDGIGFLKELGKLETDHKPVVILTTNLAHDEVVQEALSLGAKTYITKSDTSPEEFIAKIKGYL
ncbi:hypothetical protein A3B02_00015 [Candidatus Roizmanbacteria bacterium RIFCSPLOWO2_01_FULL_42_14]|uniref:Response regulatory domain-containing protein n=4 Tax=Candidatus Roizmaniibacteriota TaxID=1752723 RepID=A0A1F7K194_9BACT|nr:MAG: hypothetical protein A3D08_03375 [Candidatus Roizmanbacteria bacterium RIFCSPHIGHO2_02_FULL_43_11]OGK38862.1 MAG: hypothetical protein A3F32_02670 [Candidatus Roizmanbacteria bacterium RIFCSPHIGHO2_12_FULL_42_10]OGK52509.1 MAG: hypothetical protein A3B02_00015 [Candidatus Roizmanbacteria bacterium RIFCSPLOWO2_01_FULL_42_14]OGK61627.1 MAG: hypothetical protein A3I56_04875 [Candidatus Roizmanbacteria bacterium RIFCSPLOWO2_02_FULL_43_10]